MPVLPMPKTNLSGPCFYKFTQDNGKTRKIAKQAVTATHELWDNKHSSMESNEKLPAEKRADEIP